MFCLSVKLQTTADSEDPDTPSYPDRYEMKQRNKISGN